MAKAAAQLTARVISQPAPLALGEPPRVLRTIQALWRGVGANPSAALPQVENMPIDEKEVALFATNAREMLARPASTREIKAAVTILQGAVKWPGGEVIHNKRAFLDLMCETLRDERLSAPIIELGVRAAIKTYRWMPTP